MSARCPSCFVRIPLRAAPFRCNNRDGCDGVVDPVLAELWSIREGVGRVLPSNGWFVASERRCDACGQVSRVRICPHCHLDLPTHAGRVKDPFIAVVGATDAGKTHYVASLFERLKEAGLALDFSVYHTKATGERYARDFRRHLDARVTIPPTPSVRARPIVPLVYTVWVAGRRGGRARGYFHLVFFDSAGEDLGSLGRMSLVSRYICEASGLVVLLDPFQFARVRDALPEADLPRQHNETSEILPSLAGLIGPSRNLGPGVPIRVPLAVTLTKLDALGPLLGPWSTLPHPARHTGRLDAPAIHTASEEIESLLLEWNQRDIVTAARDHFRDHAFFAVSALGASPRPDGSLSQAPLPHRVEDPVLWILCRLGLLPEAS